MEVALWGLGTCTLGEGSWWGAGGEWAEGEGICSCFGGSGGAFLPQAKRGRCHWRKERLVAGSECMSSNPLFSLSEVPGFPEQKMEALLTPMFEERRGRWSSRLEQAS